MLEFFIVVGILAFSFSGLIWDTWSKKRRKKRIAERIPILQAEILNGNIKAVKELYFLMYVKDYYNWVEESREILGEQAIEEMRKIIVAEMVRSFVRSCKQHFQDNN